LPERTADGYLPIEHYGAIGNLRTVALVGLNGSIDWCCLPELDRPSVFGALLDRQRGGRFRVVPVQMRRSDQRYLEGTNVLETLFEAEGGRLSVTDFMPLHGSIIGAGDPLTAPEIHRILRCEEGEVEVEIEWAPRFDYARAIPRIEPVTDGFVADAKGEYLTLGGLPADAVEITAGDGGPVLHARIRLPAGERIALVTRYGSADARAGLRESLSALETTVSAWREWAHHCERPGECAFGGPWHPQVIRSGLALKLLTHPDTGAIAAAATTSLPEEIGGVRNWDYRFTWIRDAAFTSQALFALGHRAEALDFLNWAHGVSSVEGDRPFGLQIMYGLHGETELPEFDLKHLEGYRGSRPVRIGNGAAKQKQLDIYGELLGSAYELVRLGGALDPPLMAFLSRVADRACEAWREPDYGIWEVRGGPQHFVYSKVMVWVALDRAVRMAERWGLPGRVGMWRRNRDAVREAVLAEGYDRRVGAFVQSFGSKALDASNLLIPLVEFLPFDDPRVQGTIDRTLEHLTENGLVYRYRADDGLPGGEGAFALTTFWMVDALALSGRVEEAREMFEGVARRANHLGLYSEEFDPGTGAFLGNFPQAFSHIGFINSALYLARAEGRNAPAPAPVGSREHGEETGHDTGAAA
jgi:GH15 family glucan-1,4-alpha-glucosidase